MNRLAVSSVSLDLDGTLVDTVPDMHAAANAMLRELALGERSPGEIRAFVGSGIAALVERCLPAEWPAQEARRQQALAAFKRHYSRVNGQGSRLYPGVVAGLEAMRGMGLKLAVITNKATDFAVPLLQTMGLLQMFEFVVGGDSLAEKKPHPLPLLSACARLGSRVGDNLHIGDSSHDMACARAAGCPVFAVPYGYCADVRDLDCDAIVASLAEAASLIRPRREADAAPSVRGTAASESTT